MIKEGHLVTIKQDKNHDVSNTYIVVRVFDDSVLLEHPLAPKCLLLKGREEVDVDLALMKSPVEKCLDYASKGRINLGYTGQADLDSLCYYYVLNKKITPKQRHEISLMCGKLAAIELCHNLKTATSLISKNVALLDEYMLGIYHMNKSLVENHTSIKAKTEKYSIFNLAGFILANSK